MFGNPFALATADATVTALIGDQATTMVDTLESILTTNLPLVLGITLSLVGFGLVVRLIKSSARGR